VAYKGSLPVLLYQLNRGPAGRHGYCGVRTIAELRTDARFIQVSPATVRESHPHDITIVEESPKLLGEHAPMESP